MSHIHFPLPHGNSAFFHQLFDAEAARMSGIVRRAVHEVEREVGREAMIAEIKRRGFHFVECAGQFIIVCGMSQLTPYP